MDYPLDFPPSLQQRVERARDTAEIALLDALSAPKAYRLTAAWDFITLVFHEFAAQACEAERQGVWKGPAGRHNVRSFLKEHLIPHAYELAKLRSFPPAPLHGPLSLDEFRRKVTEKLFKSDVWLAYLKERSTIANGPSSDTEAEAKASASMGTSVSSPSEPPGDTPHVPTSANAPGPVQRTASTALIKWRRAFVKTFREAEGLSANQLAVRARTDESAIRAIIRELWNSGKFSEESRDRFLSVIGVSLEDWYAHRE